MSRVMELVTEDTIDTASKRAYTAFRNIGKVQEYQPNKFVKGKVYVDGWPAHLMVELKHHRDGQRVLIDISAKSGDELSRAADEAMYRFAGVFKQVEADRCIEPGQPNRKAVGVALTLAIAAAAAVAYYFGLIPH